MVALRPRADKGLHAGRMVHLRCRQASQEFIGGMAASVEIDLWKSFAQALKWTQPELVHVVSVWRDVIADRCWRNDES
jgi:hypothetical protein